MYKKGVYFRVYCFGCFWILPALCPVVIFMWAPKQLVGGEKGSPATGAHGAAELSSSICSYVPFQQRPCVWRTCRSSDTGAHCHSGRNTGVCSPEYLPKKLSELLQPKVWLSILLKEVFYSGVFVRWWLLFSGCLMNVSVEYQSDGPTSAIAEFNVEEWKDWCLLQALNRKEL